MFGKFYGGRPFNFWGGYGWFGKKCPADWFREDKSTQINSWWEKYPELRKISFMTDNAEKNLTPLYVGEKISNSREVWEKILPIQTKSVKSPIRYSPTNVQWSCQPFRGWGKKRIWHLCKCHPWTEWLARVHDVVVFKTKVFHFKIENTPIKDTNGKRKFKRMLSFFFVDKRKLFALKLSFEGSDLVFYTADRTAWLVLNQPRQRGFWRHLRYIPYSMIKEKYVFKKEFLYFTETLSTLWHRRERKTTKCAFEIDFFTMCSTDLTCVNATI